MSKRIVALSLILAILFSFACAAPASAAIEHEEQLYIDLGILPSKKTTGLIKPVLNREQLAQIIVRMQGMEGLTEGEDMAIDIARSSHKAEINYCIANNYLTLDENGSFKPTGSVTYSEAIRAMVTLLGYDVLIQNKDDDNEYLAIATKLGITRGVVVANNQKMGYNELYTLICRTMKINLPMHEFISEESVENLYDRLRIEERNGKLLANSRRSVGVERTSVGEVNIGGTIYRTQLDVPNELVGINVVYYLRDEEVVSLSPKTKIKYLTLTPYDIKSVKDTGSEVVLTCENEPETIRIKKSAVATVNNKTMAPTKALFEKFVDGSLTLVETTSGNYGVIHMDIAKTVTVSSTSQLSHSIRAKYTDELIKLEKAERNLEIYINGKAAEFSDIKKDSVVSIICDSFSFDEFGDVVYDYNKISWAKIYVSNAGVSGLIDGMEDESIFIDDMGYNASHSFKNLVSKGVREAARLGDYVNARLDYWGNIADVEVDKENGGYNYGYLIKAGVESGLDSRLELKIMDTKGTIGIYSVAKKFLVDGVSFKTAALTYDVGAADDVDLTDRQVISYRLADDGTIKSIDTQIRSPREDESTLTKAPEVEFDAYTYPGQGAVSKTPIRTNVVNKKIAIGNDCIIFSDDAGLLKTDEDTGRAINYEDYYFSVMPVSSIDPSGSYFMALYDTDEMKSAKCAVIYKAYDPAGPTMGGSTKKRALDYQTNSYLVEEVRTMVDKAGNERYKLTLVNYAGKTTYETVTSEALSFYSIKASSESDVINSWIVGSGMRDDGEAVDVHKLDSDTLPAVLERGDLIRLTLNPDGDINYLERIFAFEPVKNTLIPFTGTSGTNIVFANLYKTSQGLFMYEVPGGSNYEIFNTMDRAGVVVYDVQTGEATVVNDLSMVPCTSTGDNAKVLLRDYHNGRTREYFVYLY